MMVPKVHINLSAPGMKHLMLTQFGILLVTVGVITLTATFWWVGTHLHQDIDAMEYRIQELNRSNQELLATSRASGVELNQQSIMAIPPQVMFVKALRERVQFSWTQLLTDLESATPKHTTTSSISLDERNDSILIHGSAKSLKELNRLIHQLENHQAFQNVILLKHSSPKKKKNKTSNHITYAIKVFYQPYTLEHS